MSLLFTRHYTRLFFLIFSANSMPRIVTAAVSNRLNPSIGRTRCFIQRWSCSMTLFKYLQEHIRTRRGKVPAAFNLATARCEAAYRSIWGHRRICSETYAKGPGKIPRLNFAVEH